MISFIKEKISAWDKLKAEKRPILEGKNMFIILAKKS